MERKLLPIIDFAHGSDVPGNNHQMVNIKNIYGVVK